MSKINSLQAAALSDSVNPVVSTDVKKKTPAKTSVKKTTTAKPPVARIAATAKPVAKAATPAKAKATTVKPVAKAAKVVKPLKEKTPKLKMERDSFTMPKVEYAQLYVLKERLIKLGQASKKSELLRAGIMQLTAMTDAALKAAMAKVPAIKTGRPKKK
jgi:hypothetical protein